MLPLHSTSKVYLKFCLIFARPRLSEAGSLTRPVWNHCVSVKFSWDLVCDDCLCVCWSVEQLPTITAQSPGAVIALPFEESFTVSCEAKANPEPEWVVLHKPQLVSLKKINNCLIWKRFSNSGSGGQRMAGNSTPPWTPSWGQRRVLGPLWYPIMETWQSTRERTAASPPTSWGPQSLRRLSS